MVKACHFSGPELDYYNIFVPRYIKPPAGHDQWGGMVTPEEESETPDLGEVKKPRTNPISEVQNEGIYGGATAGCMPRGSHSPVGGVTLGETYSPKPGFPTTSP